MAFRAQEKRGVYLWDYEGRISIIFGGTLILQAENRAVCSAVKAVIWDIPEQERKNGVIRLYSIHKAKGLAFPIVIVPCLDNTLNRPITKPKIILDLKSEHPIITINNESVSKDLPIDEDYFPMLYGKIIGHLEEELRIFYVACTRAQHKLILACNKPFSYTDKALDKADYASVAKWLCQIEEGKFLKQFMKKE